MTGHSYNLSVTETDFGTTLVVSTRSREHGIQITTAQKEGYAMVYVWADVETKTGEHRCKDMEEARRKAWELARQIGEERGSHR